MATTLNMFQRSAAIPVSHWVATSNLIVQPRAGMDFNAFYDRNGLHFFYGVDPIRNKMIYSCESSDVVSHELGHALLDCLRPDLFSMQCFEAWGFHEAWGDIMAMLTTLQSDLVINKMLSEVGNDISKSNCVSRLAEEMGLAIYNVMKAHGYPLHRSPDFLRDAVNNFHYTEPEKLPGNADDDQLASEPHSFSRVFTAGFYDMLVGMFQIEMSSGVAPSDALKKARDIAAIMMIGAAPLAPAVPRFYDSIAKSLITMDQKLGGKYHNAIRDAFMKRGILQNMPLTNLFFSDIHLEEVHHMETNKNEKIVRKMDTKTIKLSDYGHSMVNEPLYDAEIEVPMQSLQKFDVDGNLVEEIKTSEANAIDAAHACVQHIKEHDLLGENPNGKLEKHFSIDKDGKLVRNFFRCW